MPLEILDARPVFGLVFVSRWPDCLLGPLYNQVEGCENLSAEFAAHFEKCDEVLTKF